MAKNDFQYGGCNSYTLQCGTITTVISSGDCTLHVACSSGIMTVNSLSGSTLQRDTWFWFRFRPHHIVDMSFCTSLRNFIQIRPEKNDVMSISRWRISVILDFRGPIMGSLKSRCTTSYRLSIDTIALKCLVFEKVAFFCILATNRQRNRQTNTWTRGHHRCTKPLSLLLTDRQTDKRGQPHSPPALSEVKIDAVYFHYTTSIGHCEKNG